MAFLAEACFEVYTMIYCWSSYTWSCYTMVSGSRNYQVTNSHLWGNFLFTVLYFKHGINDNFAFDQRKPISTYIRYHFYGVGVAGTYQTISPALYILYPSPWGHKFMVEAQFEVKSVAFSNGLLKLKSIQCHISLSKDIKFGQNVSYAVGHWNYLLLVLLTFD